MDHDDGVPSAIQNVLGPRPPTQHYQLVIPEMPPSPVVSSFTQEILKKGVSLPPRIFQRTKDEPLIQEAINDILNSGILRPCEEICYTFHLFLVAKPDGSGRPVLHLSPWTDHYIKPPIKLYSAAKVLRSIQPTDQLMKINLKSGFFQCAIRQEHQKFYGVYHLGHRYAWTRLPMGHSLALSVMQRFSQDIARYLHDLYGVSMVSYLDDWLLFGPNLPMEQIVQTLCHLSNTINERKLVLTPVLSLTYLVLNINVPSQQLTITSSCLQHLEDGF
jgi:hypothetical protein